MNTHAEDKRFIRCASALLIASTLYCASLFAAEPTASETVRFQDLNLNSAAGIEALYARIHAGARRVCGVDHNERSLTMRSIEQACAAQAQLRAVNEVHSEALSTYVQMKLGRPNAVIALNNAK